MRGRARALVRVASALAVAALTQGCNGCVETTGNPFATTASSGGAGGGLGGAGGGTPVDPELGGPCIEDAQCDDLIACTFDACDQTVQRCRFKHDDSLCQDTTYCNGAERCDQKLGCVAGEPVDCGDKNACTIDTCVEPTKSCTSVPRDADGDGDPDGHCSGKDCNDLDPNVSSLVPELCGNHVDDNCDGVIDEATCVTPENDTCLDALTISAPGTYVMNTTGAAFDYPTTCSLQGSGLHDVVAAIVLPAGPPVDVVVDAQTPPDVSIAIAGQCGDPATELACGPSFPGTQGHVSRIRARGLGSLGGETAYPLYVASGAAGGLVTVGVDFVPPEPAPTNETCGTATAITPGVPVTVDLAGVATDLVTACGALTGELVFGFSLAAPADVDVYATPVDGVGVPSISLRGAACALPEDEITCASGASAHVYRHALAAGDYYVAIAGTAPGTMSVDVELSAPTAPAPDENCVTAPLIPPNVTIDVPFDHHQDDIALGCFGTAIDAAYELDLAQPSDVLLVQRISSADSGSVQLSAPACAGPQDLLACSSGTKSPVVVGKRNVPAGGHRIVAESVFGKDQQLSAFVRKSSPTVLVPFADGCADAAPIPATGGFFQGNTASATANFTAGCDNAGGPPNGANDQLLRLDLPAKKRVIFDMSGSSYATLLDVRQGPTCPGTEVPLGCSAAIGASNAQRSYLDLTLDAGTYFVQVDGLGVDNGQWFLNVFVVDP
ncbi:MAG: MopE-related protein [Polyangiaceae bacterium]